MTEHENILTDMRRHGIATCRNCHCPSDNKASLRLILRLAALVVLTIAGGVLSTVSAARIDSVRYVKTSGSYQGDGLSWSTAKNNIQDAINELYQYLQTNTDGITSGSIYVAAGTYKPTESTESETGTLQYTAFKLYPGIHIYGGFPADITDMNAKPYNPDGSINTTYRPLINLPNIEDAGQTTQPAKPQPWNFVNKTVLSGSHSGETSFEFNASHGYYYTIFPGNSYHVVWFATSGFINTGTDKTIAYHAVPLSNSAAVDGCVITGGCASNNSTNERMHTGYGGGAYLVAGAELRNCEIYHCEATMRGGGVYLDGGGLVDKCFIHTCQSLGVGIMQGYGGGVCIDYDGAVTRSYVVNNASRIGAGITICHAPSEYPWEKLDEWRVANGEPARGEINVYSPHATACIITNNTANAEAGGLYLYDGGVGNHLTITRNKCVGQDITYSGRRHGRSGGVYILNGGQIYNSVVWGNKCAANSDIQYASSISGSTEDEKDGSGNVIKEGLKPRFCYSAIEKHDISDWAGTVKGNVMSLESTNINTQANDAYYPYFIGSDGKGKMMGHAGAGLNIALAMGTVDPDYDQTDPTSVPDPQKTGIPRPIYWKPAAISSMAKMGLQVSEAVHVSSQWVLHAHTATDIFGDVYEPMSTFGALVRRDEQFGCAMIANQEKEHYIDKGYTQAKVDAYNAAVGETSFLPTQLPDDGTESTLPTLFVDPSRNAGAAGIVIGEQGIGSTWDKPVGSINDAIHYFRQHLKKDGSGHIVYDGNGDVEYQIDMDGNGTIEPEEKFKHVQILVRGFERGKGINATTAGIDAYLGSQLRTAAVRPCSNMRIYGGYDRDATGTVTVTRDPRLNPTIVSANITKSGYENNSAHVVALINVRNVIIDGLRLFDGNANLYDNHSYAPNGENITYGGGIMLNNSTVAADERIDMTGNIFRNGYIANCSAPDGAAVYVNSSNKKGDNQYSKAELNILNTIIRNNTVGSGKDKVTDPRYGDAGVVSARGGNAKIRIDHCNIVNNCGYALETLLSSDMPSGTAADEGQIRIYNSVLYANGDSAIANRSKLKSALSCRSATGSLDNVDGDYVFLDWDAPKPKNPAHCYANLCRDFSDQTHKWGIRKMDDQTQMTLLYQAGDNIPAGKKIGDPIIFCENDSLTAAAHMSNDPASGRGVWSHALGSDQAGAVYLEYPYFDNPARNVGHSPDGDKPMNGGIISYMPGNQNPMTNAATGASEGLWDSNIEPRNRGGEPDIGAIENTHLPKNGEVIYVTPEGAGRRDGSSWDNAIAGNTVYMLDDIPGPSLATGDQIDPVATCDRVLDSSGNPILTTNTKYNGGFGRSWIHSKSIVSNSSMTYYDYITEINVYSGGDDDGDTIFISTPGPEPVETTTPSSGGTPTPDGSFTPGWYYDSRYPYGEISGASRSFWRANPYHSGTDWNNASAYTQEQFIEACNSNHWINNTRAERYVGGLQYAVEKASAYNTLAANDPARIEGLDSVQVWISNGTYTDYKGFVMRDKTIVKGGFPTTSLGTPGLEERQALMSHVIDIPKSLIAQTQNLDPNDYETILQISDVAPKQDNTHLNTTAAVNFWDDDLDIVETNTMSGYMTADRLITHTYTWQASGESTETEKTSDYYLYSNFLDASITSETPADKNENTTHTLTFGTATATKDCWHLTYTGSASTSGSNGVIGRYETNQMSGVAGANIYENGTKIGSTTERRIWLRNGSLTGVQVWQNMKNVPAGNYKIVVDMTAFYRTGSTPNGNTPTGVNFIITKSDGTQIIEPIDANKGKNGATLARADLNRYTFSFVQPSNGTLGIKIEVGAFDNTKGANREVQLANFRIYQITYGGGYDPTPVDTDVRTPREGSSNYTTSDPIITSTVATHRTSLRKRVLTMPDVCVTTFGAGSVGDPSSSSTNGKFGDELAHTHRVIGPTKSKRTSWENSTYVGEDINYVEYSDVYWDGFTIRHGFLYDERMAHGGGAGVNMYEGAHLQNCIVINNMSACAAIKGGGIFCDGATSSIEGCFVLDNLATRGTNEAQKQIFAGGMFMYEGTCFNSLFANNFSRGSGGGLGFCVGRFFNNTVAFNTCELVESNKISGGAVSLATASAPNLFVANTIIYGNNGIAIRDRNAGVNKVSPFLHCYIQSEVAQPNNTTKQNVNNWTSSATSNYGIGNIFLNGKAPSARNTPFAADFVNGVYVSGNAKATNDYRLSNRLTTDSTCINKGTISFATTLAEALEHKHGSSWANDTQRKAFYDVVAEAVIPNNDVAYAAREQDCQIDIGAYEYDGTMDIHPGYELIAFDPEQPDVRELCAVYYVAESGEGLGTAASPDDAACPTKLQKVLDAAGRLKADLALHSRVFSTDNVQVTGKVTATYEEIYLESSTKKVRQVSVPNQNLTNVKHVVVKVSEGIFSPMRSTNEKMVSGSAEDVLTTHAIAVPHGVEIWGGYENGGDHDFYETYRDPLNNKTLFQGQVTNESTGESGRTYHVLTFTNNLYGINNLLLSKRTVNGVQCSGEGVLDSLAKWNILTDRAIVDGICIEQGMANGVDDVDRRGGAAVVPNFAHVRNCVIQNNEAVNEAGGLYLEPAALVSGCVLLNNKADFGGAIYVAEPATTSESTFARVYNSTIVRNTASTRGGGIWYENNIRAKGIVLWHNSSNDMNNVSGVFDTGQPLSEDNYPFAYTAVQTRRLPGVNNIVLQAEVEKDTRWTQNSVGDMRWRGDIDTYTSETNTEAYYYIEKLSALVRAGMPYNQYVRLRETYPSLELRDMAGVARMKEVYDADSADTFGYLKHMTFVPNAKDNEYIEMGARALNNNMGLTFERPFTRLFVANPEFVDNTKATILLESGDPLYSQQGSSMANPFQKFSDALDYIVRLRSSDKKTQHNQKLSDIYRDSRFEIFIAGGTYYPTHNARGVEGHARASTFLVPEGVSVTGGLDPDVYYCQAGYNFDFLQPMSGNDTLSATDMDGNNRTRFYKLADNGTDTIKTDVLEVGSVSIELINAKSDTIWTKRPRTDVNGNNIYEPWEFLYATTFSGETPRGDENNDNVYHIFTCYADSSHLGLLPRRYSNYYSTGIDASSKHYKFKDTDLLDARTGGTEHSQSELHRMIIFNGVNVNNGNARDYEIEASKNMHNFYRGGGMLIDGNWVNGDMDSGIDSIKLNGDTVFIGNRTAYPDPDAHGGRDIPVMIRASQFLNNNAIQGGAIFTNGSLTVFESSFVQNYAMGPTGDSGDAKDSIHYHGGGAIATNGTFRCSNTIFANNEAMFGEEILSYGKAKGYTRQGFGGAIWGGQNSNVRLTNCDIVNNKGISYPAVYVDHTDDTKKFSVNTIYWGNRAAGIEDATATWVGKFAPLRTLMDLNKDVYNYRTQLEKDETLELIEKEKAGTLTFAEETRLAELRSHQIMFFCCYRPTFGPDPELTVDSVKLKATDPAVVAFSSAYPTLAANIPGTYDPHELPFLGENVNYYEIFKGNNNVSITFENDGIDGPNFVLPSSKAGREGYNPSANWMPARVNNLIDAGWSYLTLVDNNGVTEFKKSSGQNAWDVFPDNRVSGGPYNFYALMLRSQYNLTFMPFGEQFYMQLVGSSASSGGNNNMLRISSNPLVMSSTGEEKTYIDLGVYEYQHRTLHINQSSDVDVLWVSETENLDKGNDGYSWETPTSNLQAAIETLMRSRNGHDKQVNIIGGSYKPAAILGSGADLSMSFTIQTRMMNSGAMTPTTGEHFGIRSLTLRGGYDPKIEGENGYNPEKNPVVFSMAQRLMSTDDQLCHIVNILDAEQYETSMDISGEDLVKNNYATGKVIPITFEGITFENRLSNGTKPGAAIYYHKQTKYNNPTQEKSETLLDSVDNSYKLTLRNCIFQYNGEEGSGTPAVKVEAGGGRVFVLNTLFHHNDGKPLESLNTTVLNCTFAHDGGYLTLKDTTENGVAYHCSLHNSIIWQDDTVHSGATKWSIKDALNNELVMGTSDSITYNAYTLPDSDPTYGDVGDAKGNMQISKVNNDVMLGPNFADPENGDFHLYASKRVMNTGNDATYARLVWPDYYYPTPDVEVYNALMQNNHVDQSRYDEVTTTIYVNGHDSTITYYVLRAPKTYDLAGNRRLQSTHIDRGAYECVSSGQRILYVNPNKVVATEEVTGRNWAQAYGPDKLQLAIDAASIYSNNTGKQAYVFIQGNGVSQGRITVREGVELYGSLPNGYPYEAVPVDKDVTDLEYTEAEVVAYVNRVRAERGGMAAANTLYNTNIPSKISGINTVDFLAHTKGAVIDGFVISNDATTDNPATTPAVNIIVPNVVLRNCIIRDNVMADGQPVVNISGRSTDETNLRSLMYNTLVYGNRAGTSTPGNIVYVGDRGYVLNSTIIADNAGETPITGSAHVLETPAHYAEHISNIIAVNESSARGEMFAPYLRTGANEYTLPAYLTNHRPYWYQLVETSNNINGGDDNGSGADGGNAVAGGFAAYVNFAQDRDLLGNPRRLGGRIDNGCYETWYISGADRHSTTATNGKKAADVNKYVYDKVPVTDPDAEGYDATELATYNALLDEDKIIPKADFWTENYGGNHYPHIGSVIYMMDNTKLVFDTVDTEPMFAGAAAIRPGYVLMKPGSSIFGQGNALQFSYVAAEKPFAADAKCGLVSMPFDCRISATSSKSSADFKAYTYADSLRAAYNYEFHSTESKLWNEYDTAVTMPATKGWLLEFDTKLAANDTLRFTGWSTTSSRYVYEEKVDTKEKIVTLRQHDYRPSDGSARFTRQEDMGWNLVGMPYLVSGYHTGVIGTDGRYDMHIPHLMYKINSEDGTFPNTSYAEQSWTGAATLSMHEGCFMQTAAIANREDLHFRLPVYSGSPILMSPHPIIRLMNNDGEGDILRVEPDDQAEHVVKYAAGSDGVKWMMSDIPQMYMLADNRTRISLAAAAPTETNLPLGVSIPGDNNQLLTFSLPEPEAYEAYEHVWLIDRALNRVTDLMSNTYTVNMQPETNNSRFVLRIGGVPLDGLDGREYIVYAYKHQLFVRGLMPGDRIRVFGADGRLVLSATASDTEFAAQLPQTEGIYAVLVNDYSKKVTNM